MEGEEEDSLELRVCMGRTLGGSGGACDRSKAYVKFTRAYVFFFSL